jgi:hypothetical protein
MPNGGPASGAPSRTNNIQFGALNQGSPAMGSPAMLASQPQPGLGVAQPVNPRITSPSSSPSPIPQPASSGGRPPSTYQAQGNAPNFGSFGDSGDVVSHCDCSIRYLDPSLPLCTGKSRQIINQPFHTSETDETESSAPRPRTAGYTPPPRILPVCTQRYEWPHPWWARRSWSRRLSSSGWPRPWILTVRISKPNALLSWTQLSHYAKSTSRRTEHGTPISRPQPRAPSRPSISKLSTPSYSQPGDGKCEPSNSTDEPGTHGARPNTWSTLQCIQPQYGTPNSETPEFFF